MIYTWGAIMDWMSSKEKSNATTADTPIADALIKLSMLTKHSFHATPLLHGASISNSVLQGKYDALYGRHLPSIELTTTGKIGRAHV